MADVNISKYRASVVRDGSKPASPGFVVSEGQDPVNPPGTNNFVPYTGATANVELGEYGLESGFVTLDTTPTNIPTDQGAIYWDDARSTAALIMNGTLQHIGQDSFFYVKNSSGSTIPKGTCVGFAGTDGGSGHLLVTPFLANGSVPSTYFMGVTSEEIVNGAFGQVMHFGELEGINTSGFTAGALLYASSTVAGAFQTTPPVAPNNIILVAAAVNSKNNGAIVVRPTLGSNINSDEGVKITSPTTGDLLQLQAGGLWENKTKAQILGGTSSQFVKGDGSLDSNTYLTTASAASTYLPLTGGTLTGALNGTTANFSGTTFVGGGISSNVVSQSLTFDSKNILYGNLTIGQVPAQATLGVGASGIVTEFPVSTALTIKNTGNLLVGTTTDNGARLQVSGTATFSSSVTAGSFIRSGGTSSQYLMADGSVSTLTNPVTGTGTTNYLPKFTGTSTIGNSATQTDTTGNLMVGSANAGNAGTINVSVGVAGTTAGGLQLWAASNQTHYIQFGDGTTGAQAYAGYLGYAHSTDSLLFGTNGADKMTLNSSGNLGLGVTPSAWNLGIAMQFTAGSLWSLSTSDFNVMSNTFYSSGYKYVNSIGALRYFQDASTSSHSWHTAPSGTAGNAISFTQAMTLTAGGNLLVGTTTDNGARLQVSGAATLTGTIFANTQLNNTVISPSDATNITNGFNLLGSQSYWGIRTTTAGNFALDVYGAGSTRNALTILQASGNVGIGTISPQRRLDIFTTSNSATEFQLSLRNGRGSNNVTSGLGFGFNTASADPDYLSAILSLVTNRTTRAADLIFQTAATGSLTERMRITSGGNVLIGTTTDNGARLQVSGNATFSSRIQAQEFFSVGSLNDTDGSFLIDHPFVQTWKIGITNNNTSTFSIGNDNDGSFASKYFNIANNGNVLIGTTTSGSSKLRIVGLPTSSSGLSSGDVWNDGGTLKIA